MSARPPRRTGLLRELRRVEWRRLLLAVAVLAIWVRLLLPVAAQAATSSATPFLCTPSSAVGVEPRGPASAPETLATECPFCRVDDAGAGPIPVPVATLRPPDRAIGVALAFPTRAGSPALVPAHPPARGPPGDATTL